MIANQSSPELGSGDKWCRLVANADDVLIEKDRVQHSGPSEPIGQKIDHCCNSDFDCDDVDSLWKMILVVTCVYQKYDDRKIKAIGLILRLYIIIVHTLI